MAEPLTLYVIPLSHSARTGELMLEHKDLEYRRVRLVSGLHRPWLRALGFRRGVVPALRIGRRRVEGTLEITRALEEIRPDPPLRPRNPELRDRLDAIEEWGETDLQPIPRRLYRWAVTRFPRLRRDLAELNHLPLPGLTALLMKPVAAYYARLSGADDEAVRRDLQAIPGMLDRVDSWIADGFLDGEQLFAADYQIAPSVRLLMNLEDLRPVTHDRPAADLALRIAPEYAGETPPVFPPQWLPPDPD